MVVMESVKAILRSRQAGKQVEADRPHQPDPLRAVSAEHRERGRDGPLRMEAVYL